MPKRMTEQKFEQAKQLKAMNLTGKQIADIIGLSTATVGRIFRSASFEDYKALVNSLNPHNRQRAFSIPVEEEAPVSSDEHTQAVRELTEAVKQLTKSLGV